jgi:membrane-associated phospholipid phosphatase
MLRTKVGLGLLLAVVFVVNLAETAVATHWGATLVPARAYHAAVEMRRIERNLTFEHHDATNRMAIFGYSTLYFFAFPALAVAVAGALASREELAPFRVLCLAVTIDYGVSLICFLILPVPERWAFPDSGAILLSDQLTSQLIEKFRPVSGLNNCFPSFHTSLSVILIWVCYVFRARLRTVVLCLGVAIIISTFVLGIHWLADIGAGLLLGSLSVALALRLTDTSECWRPTWGTRG